MLDEQTTETASHEAPGVPESLTFRVEHPKRLLHAARALSVLEADLRALMQHVGIDVGDDALHFAVQTYRDLRGEVIGLLDGDTREIANDELIGFPSIGDDAGFNELLLKLSQATRCISVEEAWPTAHLNARIAQHTMRRTNSELNAADAANASTPDEPPAIPALPAGGQYL